MGYPFRKNISITICVVLCSIGYCESADEDLSISKLKENDNKQQNLSGTNSLKTSFYSIAKEEDTEPPLLDGVKTKKLGIFNDLKTIKDITDKLSGDDCIRDVTHILEATIRREIWALEILDSIPKFPDGLLYGNFYQLGNFDECVRTKQDVKIDRSNNSFYEHTITGQYCLADIYFKTSGEKIGLTKANPIENTALKKNRSLFATNVIHWAVCLPSTCSNRDTEVFTKEIFSSFQQDFEITSVHVDANKCETQESLPITAAEIVYGAVLGVFLILTLLATFLHCWYLYRIRRSATYNLESLREAHSSTIQQTVNCFSIISTTKRFFHTKPNELNLESICGIKFLTMITIIAGHSLIFFFGGPTSNTNFFIEVSTGIENTIFMNGPILVDTFLLLSGFLMCRLLLIELDKRKGKINFLTLYIARYIRLTPAYAVVLGLYTSFLYRMGTGPFWKSRIGVERERCKQSWWLNLLYVNNYVGTDNLCMFQSWYLAVDYHLFIIAPIVIYGLWKKPQAGEVILVLSTIVSILLPFSITYVGGLDPTLLGYPMELEDLGKNFYFVNYYIKTHMRCSSYCIGLFYAYLVHKIQKKSKKIPQLFIVFGWIFAVIFSLASMVSIVVFFQLDHNPNIIENALYAALHRVGWALSIGWVILVCVTDNSVFVNKFLSHKFFISASRLTYCAYLANGLVEIYSAGVTRQPMYMSIFELTCKTVGHIVLTFVLAFVLCIIFESPIHGMEKVLLKNFDKSNRNTKTKTVTVVE